jgi:uncharacterized protein (DUF2336 family)
MDARRLHDDLADLARSNQQTRDAALLRATTDLFVQEAAHDRDELHRYEELAIHFLPKVAVADRKVVAGLLALCPDAPAAVVRMLARDIIEVAAPIIRRSPVLQALDLLSVIAATGPQHHRLIARRMSLDDDVKRALRLTGDADVLGYLDDGQSMRSPETAVAAGAAPVSAPQTFAYRPVRDAAPDRLDPWRFLSLDRPARLRLIADLASRPPQRQSAGSASRLDRAFRSILGAAQIVGFARGGRLDALIGAIADGLELQPDLVAAAVNDATGEALAVMLKTLRLDDAQAQQVFLLATATGTDTATFFPLADLYSSMEPSVADALAEAWRTAGRSTGARHQPHMSDTGERARRSEGDLQRRPAAPAEERARRA